MTLYSSATFPLALQRRGATITYMENGHSYPSEYAWNFGERSYHPATQRAVVDELRRPYGSDWPAIWVTIMVPP